MDTLTKKADILREGATSLALDEKEFRYFCKFIKDKAGISLTSAKIELVKTRLRKRLQAKAVSTYRQYRELLEGLPKNDPEWQSFINILTT
ncbi:MAG: chemotaxis protein-glutamate O-methyltransferase, partial [Bacteriovorax sp.]